ncbi:MAG: adenosylcobalamin-dependent ribonucleoside-diphosphate reductase [Gammaproteobacteria bacterium]|nr:adenosylcobalamin-dependent ribonucleoside-diphosphate reductase [Gammaproteobacteria bacterium]MDH5652718.1 adenosylcobalamin-dependent ribonucleoside-diphosphate reductase [Gammaproteobacteria bacterium]
MNHSTDLFSNVLSRQIWQSKYRYCEAGQIVDQSIQDSWRRVAKALSVAERDANAWEHAFYQMLEGFRFLPGGRILAGAGIPHQVTLFNCFVMGAIEDSIDGIFDALKEGALTMQQGGGVGYDFSNLRPQGTRAKRVGGIASGPVSFMRIWDSMCATLLSTGVRRGAMMATLRCDHPDIERFIRAKQDQRELRHFNLSVLVTDALMEAVETDAEWPLIFPAQHLDESNDAIIERNWCSNLPIPCRVVRTIRARDLWDMITRANYEYAEPGVLFIDRINQENNLAYREYISATNPCGEIPLPPYGACDLGSINLTQFVLDPFTETARLDLDGIIDTTGTAVRFMDNVIDVSQFPLPQQHHQAQGTRRVGLGITGLADMLLMLGLSYQGEAARQQAAQVMQTICLTAYRSSIALAKEKGSFPLLNKSHYLAAPFIRRLPEDIHAGIAQQGIRNSHLLAVAPTGTISLLANNISSGIEPVFQWDYQRRILQENGEFAAYKLEDYAAWLWRKTQGEAPRPDYFVDSSMLQPADHLAMQAAVQPWVDNAISKTINIPADYPYESFKDIYQLAYHAGLKGCTTFRPNPVTGSILASNGEPSRQCCTPEREAD